jgi:hypothetical protein
MALYIPRGIFYLARLLYVRPQTFGPTLVCSQLLQFVSLNFPVIRGNLGPVHVEISQFYCLF